MAESSEEKGKVLNFNVGVLGHADIGKTSLSKTLSTVASTAAFDQNPQSRQRSITLDLRFSSFLLECPSQLKTREDSAKETFENLQITLVGCPGHASLLKTIIGKFNFAVSLVLFSQNKKNLVRFSGSILKK